MIKNIPLNLIEFKEDLYPRAIADWQTTYRYTQVLLTNGRFPAICVADNGNKKYILIDGFHRVSAYRKTKKKVIEAEILKNVSEKEMFIEAIRRNTIHGIHLNPYDLAKAVEKLKKFNVSRQTISEITHIPIGKLEQFVIKRLTKTYEGNDVFLRKPLQHLSNIRLRKGQEIAIENIDEGHSQVEILQNLIDILKSRTFQIENKNVVKKLKELYELLEDILK